MEIITTIKLMKCKTFASSRLGKIPYCHCIILFVNEILVWNVLFGGKFRRINNITGKIFVESTTFLNGIYFSRFFVFIFDHLCIVWYLSYQSKSISIRLCFVLLFSCEWNNRVIAL